MIRPIVDRALSVDGGVVPSYALECRDVICRLTFVDDNLASLDVETALERSTEFRQHAEYPTVSGGRTTDLLTKEKVRELRVYFRLLDDEDVAGEP